MGLWYRQWYAQSPMGETLLREALTDQAKGELNKADVRRRLDEMKNIPEERCAITRDQRRFLERVLASL